MKVLVTFAVEAEFAPWRGSRAFRETTLNPRHYSGGIRVRTAKIGDHEVHVFLTGMGIKRFGFEAGCCAKDAGIEAVLSSGLVGSLNPQYAALMVIAPRRVGDLRNATGLAVSQGLLELAGQRGAAIADRLLTSDRLIKAREEKAHLARFADAVDMESIHVLEAFDAQQIPVVVIRAVSDGFAESMPVDFDKCLTSSGRVKTIPLLRELALKPAKLPQLMRFGKQSTAAARKLAKFMDEYIQALTPETLKDRVEEAIGE